MQIEVIDQLERDRGKVPNNQELQSVETQQMYRVGAAAPNHQLSAEDSGQFPMTTSGGTEDKIFTEIFLNSESF